MAASFQPSKKCYNGLKAPDAKVAKNALAKAAKSLKNLLDTDSEEKRDVLAQHGLLRDKSPKSVFKELQETIVQEPALFWVLLREIENFADGAEAARKLEDNCSPKDHRVVLDDLRKKLNIFKDMNPPDEILKSAINDAISKELKNSTDVGLITNELAKLQQEELISPELLTWATTETQREHGHILEANTPTGDQIMMMCSPVELNHDDLYHASLCSTVVNTPNATEQCKRLIQSLSYKSVKELSLSWRGDVATFPKCMIAISSNNEGTTTCYVAFENIIDYKVWKLFDDGQKASFGKVLERQLEKFPTLYLETVIKRKERLVLTGFSFGGVLAQMVAAQLWLLPHTSIDQLMSNVICITFGQPLVQSLLLTHVAESYPDFRNNVHAIGLKDDKFPSIVEKVDSLTLQKEVELFTVLENLQRLQEFYSSLEQSNKTLASSSQLDVPDEDAFLESEPSCTSEQDRHDDGDENVPTHGYDAQSKAPQSPLYVTWSGAESFEDAHKVEGAIFMNRDSESRHNRNELAHKRTCDVGIPLISSRNMSDSESASSSNVSHPVITDPAVFKAEKELKKLMQSRHHDKSDETTDFAAKQHLIMCDDSGFKLIETSKELQESLKCKRMADLIRPACFDQHSAGVYYRSIKKLTYKYERPETRNRKISSDFLCPTIDQVKVTQYGSEAIVVVKGQRLWFVHSIQLSATLTAKEPFQAQEVSVSFKAPTKKEFNWKGAKVTILSHFSEPITKGISVESNPDSLSPRGKQIARLEPARLLELGFMMSLLEKSANRFNSTSQLQPTDLPPFVTYFKQFLLEMLSVVPYESILCAVAHCQNKRTAELCTRMIKRLHIEFPFSLTTYASSFVAAFKVQHRKSGDASMADFFNQLPFEDCAYFIWLKAKYMKGTSSSAAVASFSEEIFTDPYIFVSLGLLDDDALYLRQIIQQSLKQVNTLSEVRAVSNKSATDLYSWSSAGSGSSKQEARSLKSPISGLIEGREVLHPKNDTSIPHKSGLRLRSYDETMKVLNNARGGQFDLGIGVLCGFMYQHVRVPFTDFNPMTFWKSLRHHIAPYSDVFKNDSEFWTSILKRCQRAIAKGSQVAENTYDAKLKFLVNNIDPETKGHTTPTASEYSMYTFEKKLKELCLERGITKDRVIDRIVLAWKTHFECGDCPMAKVASTHRSLISRWIKWSLMIHELRLTLEKHITIAIPGLVNSGKTQLIRSLFGLDVKAGTTEQRRTIVPFMYSLAPDIKNVHIIDLPGADDSDKNVSQLTEFLKFISQIVVFVVSYDKAHTKDAKKWLEMFENKEGGSAEANKGSDDFKVISDPQFESVRIRGEESGVPVLVCMTFADRLLAEMLDDNGKYNEGMAKKDIAKHFEDISSAYYGQRMSVAKGKRTLGYYCFNLSKSTLEVEDVQAVGIKVPLDVGEWICRQITDELHERDTAEQLRAYFSRSCRKLKEV